MFFVSTLVLIFVIFSTGIYKEITKLFIVIIDIVDSPYQQLKSMQDLDAVNGLTFVSATSTCAG